MSENLVGAYKINPVSSFVALMSTYITYIVP